MSASQLKPGDRVFVTTDSQCQYEGFFRALNESNGTFTLTKVRAIGSKDGSIKGSHKIHECVEFVAANVVSFLALDDEDGLRSDPAIVSITDGYFQNSRRRSSFPPVRRSSSGDYSSPKYNGPRFSREYRPDYWQPNDRSYRKERTDGPSRYYRPRQPQRAFWSDNHFQPRNSIQREGSFPQKNPGQKKNIGEYDIDKGLEEFSRLKLSGEDGEVKADKGYNKEESFFDSLTVDGGVEDEKEPEVHRGSPRKAQRVSQNVLTFGEDTVRSLNFYRKPFFGVPNYRETGFQNIRYGGGYASGFVPAPFIRTRGYMRRRFF